MPATYDFASGLAAGLRRTADAYGWHERKIRHADRDWPDRYTRCTIDVQPGLCGHAVPGASA